ncbi:hypothetical protein BVC80_1835g94 [Macleaya cordata]|uniref:Uncharacterized protein n=1 Tax=Macleaya cordata TaxID=56857 RepID=A0A200R4V1_MACCD|nr:hypothetical protein BVC80_1835g94 [Macleaya cordata]
MGKQTKAKKTENLGKGKVTPVQVAFIVDRYLSDNNYTQTRSIFRTEASTLLSKTQAREAPKSLLSLGAILDEYICLKEQKVMLDQEKSRVEQEKFRVETLLQGMQDVMHAYNSGGSFSPPSISTIATKSMALVSQSNPNIQSTPGIAFETPTMNSVPWLSNSTIEPTNFSTPTINLTSGNKRRGSKIVPDALPTAKRPCSQIPKKLSPVTGTKVPLQAHDSSSTQETVQQQFSVVQSTPHYRLPSGSSHQGSSVAKSLFKQPSSSPTIDSPGPKTPPQTLNQTDISVSPSESASLVNSTNGNSPQDITPTNCPLTSSETVPVSPFKHVSYYSVERNHYISSPIKTPLKRLGKRDHVKGRLDFDASNVPTSLDIPMTSEVSTSGASGGGDIFDIDIPNFDIFGADFSLSELLVDIDFDCEGTGPATNLTSGTTHEYGDASIGENQTLSELSSSVTEVLCEKNVNIEGSDSLATSVKSITKCIRILSPAKNRRSPSLDQENLSSRDLVV